MEKSHSLVIWEKTWNLEIWMAEKNFWALKRHATLQQQISSLLTITPLFGLFLSFAGFPGTNWCCVKVWVAKESPPTLLGPRLWRQPRKGIYCWTLVAGPWSKTETGGPFGPSPVGAPSTSATQTSKCTKSEPKNILWLSFFSNQQRWGGCSEQDKKRLI